MRDDQFDDLKQFIDTRISQSEDRFDRKLEALNRKFSKKIEHLDAKVDNLRTEMHDGFAGVAEAIEGINGRAAKTERSLAKLRRRAA